MKTLYMTKGLPASGKTTHVKKMQEKDSNIVRVNKDDLRAMLHNGKWSRHNEKQVIKIRDLIVSTALADGRYVVVDDTNFAEKHENQLRSLAKLYEARFEILDFTAIPLETCIERDSKRANSVGASVIRKMYDDYLKPEIPVIEYNPELPDCYIVDIDGTIALMKDRSPYDWDRVGQDELNKSVVDIVNHLRTATTSIIFVSGRDGVCFDETYDWLSSHGLNPKFLFMRPEGDNRPDTIIKKEIYEKHIKDKYNVLAVFDDRDKVVRMWRELGLTCLQVAEGNF